MLTIKVIHYNNGIGLSTYLADCIEGKTPLVLKIITLNYFTDDKVISL